MMGARFRGFLRGGLLGYQIMNWVCMGLDERTGGKGKFRYIVFLLNLPSLVLSYF